MGKPDHGIEAILFDLDGVLVDASPWHHEALSYALHEFGYNVDVDEIKKYEGLTTPDKLEKLSNNNIIPYKYHGAIDAIKQKRMLEIIEERQQPVEATFEAVSYADYLMPCAVVTNCSRDAAHLMLEKANIKHLMSAIITRQDVAEGCAKPSPLPYLMGAWTLKKFPKNCLAFDDTIRGITSAREAGCRFHRIEKFGDLTKGLIKAKLKQLRIRL